jgi:hypothetical protein
MASILDRLDDHPVGVQVVKRALVDHQQEWQNWVSFDPLVLDVSSNQQFIYEDTMP